MSLFYLFLLSILEDFLDIIATEPTLPSPTRTPPKRNPNSGIALLR
ncbi:hypothetical protein [Sulfurimonas sp. RIFOXYB12_FULL_35_9]|nr:hypothetical protein [Sulfurimonas sp. RIFOXYB12_FULL_35_9]